MTAAVPPWEGGPSPMGDSVSGGYASYTSVSDAIYELVRRADETDKAQAKTHALAVAAAGSADTLHDTARALGDTLMDTYRATCASVNRVWRFALAALTVAVLSVVGNLVLAAVMVLR